MAPLPDRDDAIPAGFDWDAWCGVGEMGNMFTANTTRRTGVSGWILERRRLVIWAATFFTRGSKDWETPRRPV